MIAARTLVSIVAMLVLLPAGLSKADCCAPGQVDYLVYGGGLARGRAIRPYAGVANPRYTSTQTIGGPLSGSGASQALAMRGFVNTPQLEAVATAAMRRQLEFASDAELMEQPAVGKEAIEEPDGRTPDYPGQTFQQALAMQQEVAVERSRATQGPPNRTTRAKRQPTTVRPQLSGAFANESAARIARTLQVTGIGF